MKNTIRKTLLVAAFSATYLAAASSPVIGVARSRGALMINHASTPGSATLWDGTVVQTLDASSVLNLNSGERVTIDSNSSVTVHEDRLTLEKGAAEILGGATYRVDVKSLQIGAQDSNAQVRVVVNAKNRVLVGALTGSAEVRNSAGFLVARVFPGAPVEFTPSSPTSAEVTGVVREQNGKYFLTDDITKVQVELRGDNLKKMIGKRVHVTGTVAGDSTVAGASEVVTVASVTVVAGAAVAVAAAGGAAAGAGVAVGSGVTIAIIGGVAATAGTLGGLAASGVIGGSDATVSR